MGKCCLGSIGAIKGTLGLAGHEYFCWLSDLSKLQPDTQFLNLKLAPCSGWSKGQNALWEEIAAGSEDAQISTHAARLNGTSRKLAVVLHHEPIIPEEGSATDLKAAVTRISARWRAAGVTHYIGQCLVGQPFRNHTAASQIAIDACDIVGVDAYGNATRPLAPAVFDDWLEYTETNGKKGVIFETNFQNALPGDGQQAAYYASLNTYLQAHPTVIGAAMWPSGQGPLNPEGTAALTSMAADPFYGRSFASPATATLTVTVTAGTETTKQLATVGISG